MSITQKKILFLLRGETTPSSRHRVWGYLPYLKEEGMEVEAIPVPKNFLRIFFLAKAIYKSQVVVIQKKVLHAWELYFLRLLNKNIIYDIDDLATERPKEKKDIKKNVSREARFWLTVRLSRAVITGNIFLQEYVAQKTPQKKIIIIPTPIDTRKYEPKVDYRSRKIVIGWIGLPGNLLYLDMMRNVLIKLSLQHFNIALKIVCSHFVDIPQVEIIKKQWNKAEEIPDLQSFDIGIMPLFDDIWSKAKCGFKALQCMGVGVPVVVSPVGINETIVRDGENGFLAGTEEEWYQKLTLLIRDERLRERIGKTGRETIKEKYSVEVCAAKLKELLLSL